MLTLIEFKPDNTMTRATVIVESDATDPNMAYAELQGAGSRNMAVKEASIKGMADPRINENPAVFRVSDKGELLTNPDVQKSGKFRARIQVIKKLI